METIIKSQKAAKERNAILTKWAKEQRKYLESLDTTTKQMIQRYTSGYYTSDPESYKIEKGTGSIYTDYPEIIKKLIEVIKEAPKLGIPLKLFRGVTRVHPVDDVIVSPYLSSTSFNKNVSIGFIDKYRGQNTKCCLYSLNMPADFPGLLIGRRNDYEIVDTNIKNLNTSFDDEYEVLVPPFVGNTTKTIKNDTIEYETRNIIFPEVEYSKKNVIKISFQ
jgi:hypothetical protein